MHSQGQSSIPVFRMISLVAIAMLMIAIAVPLFGQNSVPPTAVQAAKMPQFASRLAHPARRMTPPKSQVFAGASKHRRPLDSNDIYDNGPINGNTDAWTIGFGFIVSDTFTVASDGTNITGMSFGAWLYAGDTLTSAELSITSGENSGTSYFDQTVKFAQGSCTVNQYGYNICTETTSFNGPALNAGTYWVNLQNASVPSGDPVYWDENSGVGCQGQGCPSLASQNDVGSIPSEAFTILGGTTTTTTTSYNDYACPAPQSGFHDLHDLGMIWQQNDPASGVAIDSAGNLYGTVANLGSYGQGLLYQLAHRAGKWFLTSLYSFLGGSQGSAPNGVIVGPSGALYGAVQGGFQTCGNDGASYCGLIYEAKPGPAACATALCGWDATTVYQFTGNTDAWGGNVVVSDSAGNLYGISGSGGAYNGGAVFELTPAQGGWTEKILYNFPGGNDGAGPNSLLLGHDGNLYGTAGAGAYGYGVVFQLVPSAGGWTENVLYAFAGSTQDGDWPNNLVQDRAGNLYGISTCYSNDNYYCPGHTNDTGLVFELSPSGGGWAFSVMYSANCGGLPYSGFSALAVDASGNIDVTEWGLDYECGPSGCYYYTCGNVTNASSQQLLVSGNANVFNNLSSDANGNLYGTTDTCGFGTLQRNTGMIWQYSP